MSNNRKNLEKLLDGLRQSEIRVHIFAGTEDLEIEWESTWSSRMLIAGSLTDENINPRDAAIIVYRTGLFLDKSKFIFNESARGIDVYLCPMSEMFDNLDEIQGCELGIHKIIGVFNLAKNKILVPRS